MIVNKHTGYLIQRTEEVLNLPEHVQASVSELDTQDWLFVVPITIEDNQEKTIYKVGFLREFYKNLNPEMSYSDIYQKINSEWQVFKSNRQMERLYKDYVSLFAKKGGN